MNFRFIQEKCNGYLRIENREQKEMIEELIRRGYPSDPVNTWKMKMDREAALEETVAAAHTEDKDATATNGPETDYDYLLDMALWSLTREKQNQLLKKRNEKKAELEVLKKRVPSDLWIVDLNALSEKVLESFQVGAGVGQSPDSCELE
ncbi:hypothetical protein V9T40_007262 [Parthenolecanium corni]|uniref:DNA topoisomerase (ATP-hydrolyzing) n=1 Tax=Parthenolecanium corni TaxID=536013 RepID=A0AAN9YBG5_9HEMI